MKEDSLPYDYFTEQQKDYLEKLCKFAGRTQRTRIVTSQEMPSKKYQYIKQNFVLLDVDEQFQFNESQRQLDKHIGISMAIGIATGLITMSYFVMARPLHQKLYFEGFKSFAMGGLAGFGYYQYWNYQFREQMHKEFQQNMNNQQMFIFIIILVANARDLPILKVSIGPTYPQLANSTETEEVVYFNQTLNDLYNMDAYPAFSCVPNNLSKFKVQLLDPVGPNIQQFKLPLQIQNLEDEQLILRTFNVSNLYDYQEIDVVPQERSISILDPKAILIIDLIHYCKRETDNNEYWSILTVYFRFSNRDPVEFQYQFICDPDYHPKRFDWSNIILIVFESIIILILATFGKIYSFKVIFKSRALLESQGQQQQDSPFQGFELYWVQAVCYMGLLLLSLFISMIYQEKAEEYIKIIVYIFCSFQSFHFIDELFCLFRKEVPFLVQKLFIFRYCDIFSILITFILVFCYLYFDQPWFVSNMLSICILGSLIKLFKITSLKDALQFFIPIILVDIACSLYLANTVRYEWDSVALRYFNTPLSAQIPYFRIIYKKKCGWVSVFNILFPGFFLGYVHRFDRFKQTYVYEIVSFLGLIVGLVLWVVVQYLSSFPLPTSIFTEILMVLVCTLISYNRNEFNLFWSGQFYDEILENPFKNELNKASIKVINLFGIGQSRRQQSQRTEQKNQELVKQTDEGKVQLDSILFQGLRAPDSAPIVSQQNNQQFQSNLNYFRNQERVANYQPPR